MLVKAEMVSQTQNVNLFENPFHAFLFAFSPHLKNSEILTKQVNKGLKKTTALFEM